MAFNPKAGDLMNTDFAKVITVKGDIDIVAGTPLTFTGIDDDGTPLVAAVTTEGAGFELIGLYETETPGYYAAACDGAVFVRQNGSIIAPGYALVGYDGDGGIKKVTEGGRAVVVFLPVDNDGPGEFLACIKI